MVSSVSSYVEATLLLLPPDAGGRTAPVAPRDGSYRPFAWIDRHLTRLRLLEGPSRIDPGEEARVVLEIESDVTMERGVELRVMESGERIVGIATVLRVWGKATV